MDKQQFSNEITRQVYCPYCLHQTLTCMVYRCKDVDILYYIHHVF